MFASANAKKTANNGGHPEGATQIGLLEPVCIGFTIQASVHICQESSCPSAIHALWLQTPWRWYEVLLSASGSHFSAGVLRLLLGV